ncbi:PA2778 family cysteine peptidase [Noviherbaspirillum galbum]|uniref:PA2778 family cysteine peptidase n=1 Tax=Noviherbaspirillum galbum TaxID=2709383 RepID=A0A6B3SMI0_9BURK|nr:PA2778 family cysteine peptidase [Noviherbaspirillum galbum]NEX60535.1 PA2778 family cysteine peptidase [Noviherbaspirillum galbum]
MSALLACALACLILGGCATQTMQLRQAAGGLPRHAELDATPFFPQERYQCGPAALATVLNASGLPGTPDALVAQVYVPAREGSLQPEMLAAARRQGAPAMLIPPRLDALLEEVASGMPVLVLQNLSLPIAPLWHYAVVVGYNLDTEEIVLRSGTTRREVMSMSTFEHTWARGDDWGMVAPAPGSMPRTVKEDVAVEALVAFEKAAPPGKSYVAYQSALVRFPRNLALRLGAGNAAYAMGDRAAAAEAFRQAAADHPRSAPAFNNLATVLAEMGRASEAREAARQAVALGGPWLAQSEATLREIEAGQGGKPAASGR